MSIERPPRMDVELRLPPVQLAALIREAAGDRVSKEDLEQRGEFLLVGFCSYHCGKRPREKGVRIKPATDVAQCQTCGYGSNIATFLYALGLSPERISEIAQSGRLGAPVQDESKIERGEVAAKGQNKEENLFPDYTVIEVAPQGQSSRNQFLIARDGRACINFRRAPSDVFLTYCRYPQAPRLMAAIAALGKNPKSELLRKQLSAEVSAVSKYADFLPLDFDHEANPEKALAELRQFLEALGSEHDVDLKTVRLYWSGSKGFSVEIPARLFGWEPAAHLHEIFRRMALAFKQGAYDTLDVSIYDARRLWRVPNTRHGKSGLFKIPLTAEEIFRLSLAEIKRLAERPRYDVRYETDCDQNPALYDLYLAAQRAVDDAIKAKPEPVKPSASGGSFRLSRERRTRVVDRLLPYWTASRRHQLALALGGLCAKHGLDLNEARQMVGMLAERANDNEPEDRLTAVMSSYERHAQGEAVKGLAALEELIPRDMVEHVVVELTEIEVHLLDIEDVRLKDRRVVTEVRVVGVGEAYFVPHDLEFICQDTDTDHGRDRLSLSSTDPILIECLGVRSGVKLAILRRLCPLVGCKNVTYREQSSRSVTELIAYPKVTAIEQSSSGQLVDELGREFRKKRLFLAGRKTSSHQLFEVRGKVIANPKNQVSTLLCDALQPLGESVAAEPLALSFEQLDEIIERLPALTKIQGRPDAHETMLLTFASPIGFFFEDQLQKGWMESGIFGGPRTGKTQIGRSLIRLFGRGLLAVGEAATRAGLLYGIETLTTGHAIQWGLLPQCDGGLLVVDGVNALSDTDWVSMREARSQGIVRVHRIVSGEHPCRTRLILVGNTKHPLSKYEYAVSALSELRFEPPDIARFDLVLFFGEDDVPAHIINAKVEGEPPDLRAIGQNIAFAWQVAPEAITFDEEAVALIYARATEAIQVFGGKGSHEIPLVSNDVKIKLARLSVACALLCGATRVTEAHVERVSHLAFRLMRSAKLDRYVVERRKQLQGGEEAEIESAFKMLQMELAGDIVLRTMVQKVFLERPQARFSDIQALTGAAKATVSDRLKELVAAKLLAGSTKGYARTLLFDQVLKRLREAGCV